MSLYLFKQLNKLNKPVFCGQTIARTLISRDAIRSPITTIKSAVDLDEKGTNEQCLNTLLIPPPPPPPTDVHEGPTGKLWLLTTIIINTFICSQLHCVHLFSVYILLVNDFRVV